MCRTIHPRDVPRVLRSAAEDVVLIDLPGRDDPGLPQILKAVDLLLIPAKPCDADMEAVSPVREMARAAGVRTYVVLNEVVGGDTQRVANIKTRFADLGPFCPVSIHRSMLVIDAYRFGHGVIEYKNQQHYIVCDYKELAKFIVEKLWGRK